MLAVRELRDVFANPGEHVDCFVSTDIGEIGELLEKMGYNPDGMDFGPSSYSFKRGSRSDIRIEVFDIPIEEDTKWRKGLGFSPMSKIRIYVTGSRLREAAHLEREFLVEKQNVAFVNNRGIGYIRLSEFYKSSSDSTLGYIPIGFNVSR